MPVVDSSSAESGTDRARPFWSLGRAVVGAGSFAVRHPYDGAHVATVSVPTADQVEQAVQGLVDAAPALARTSAHVRATALRHVAARLLERQDELAALITSESGKPLKWATVEVRRASSTFQWAAEEIRRWSGDVQRLDTDEAGEGRLALVRRVPRGPVLGISPFNFPLNLVAHKVAPALAAGAPILLKPAPKTPLSALALGELLAETDLPTGSWAVLPVPDDRMPALVQDPRLPVVSFTGSGPVGWAIRDAVPRKHVTLELGGNAAAYVAADWSSDADLAWAAERIATFANYQAGQSCISVQRVLVERPLVERFTPALVAAVEALGQGDPRSPATDVGPLIDQAAAERVERWVQEAVADGGQVLTGGRRTGCSVEPTVLVDVADDAKVLRDEVFGPVLVLQPVDGVEDAFARINDSAFGLQAGVLTRDLSLAFAALERLQVGGVVVGDVPSYRAEQMPYGGVKGSGTGREGVRAAMTDLTEERVLVLSTNR